MLSWSYKAASLYLELGHLPCAIGAVAVRGAKIPRGPPCTVGLCDALPTALEGEDPIIRVGRVRGGAEVVGALDEDRRGSAVVNRL